MRHSPTKNATRIMSSLLLLLAACGDDEPGSKANAGDGPNHDAGQDADTTSAALTGIAAFGAGVALGDVRAKCEKGAEEYTGKTDANGAYELPIPEEAYPCMVQVSGGNLPAGMPLLHSWAVGAGTAHVTPLTDLSLALAIERALGVSPAEWFAAPTGWSAVTGGLAAAVDNLRKALVDAGYTLPSAWSAGSDAPFTATFSPDPASDPFDQLLEAFGAGVAASEQGDYQSFLSGFRAGTAALPEAPAKMETPTGNTAPATLHVALANTYALTFHVDGGPGCGSACSYVDEQQVEFIVHANGTLSVAGKTLSSPFAFKVDGNTRDTEISWRDGDLVYSLSDNSTGVFNEINLGLLSSSGDGLPTFLGQFRPGSAADELITQFAGSYDITHRYRGVSSGWTGLTIGADGSFTIAGGPAISPTQIENITDRISCCGRVDLAVKADLDGDSTIEDAVVNLYANASGGLMAVELLGAGFRVDASQVPAHDGTDIPATNAMSATAQIDGGEAITVEVSAEGHGSPVFHNLSLSGRITDGEPLMIQQSIDLQLQSSTALTAGQSYNCYENAASGNTTRVAVKTGTSSVQEYGSKNGGRCTITLTTVEIEQGQFTLVEGTFTAELPSFKRNDPKVTVNDGVFRWAPGDVQ